MTQHALVLGNNMTKEGQLGPGSVMRCERGLAHHFNTGDTLVVAATRSPMHRKQKKSLAQLMKEWLFDHNCKDVVVLDADMFNTLGELWVFYQYVDHAPNQTIISTPIHLERVQVLMDIVQRDLVYQKAEVEDHQVLKREQGLESGKMFFWKLMRDLRIPYHMIRPIWLSLRVSSRAVNFNPSW